jgi:hypothetical protein
MKKERFEELCQAVRQAGAVRRGEAAPARAWEVKRGRGSELVRRQLDPERYRRARRAEWEHSLANARARGWDCPRASLPSCWGSA